MKIIHLDILYEAETAYPVAKKQIGVWRDIVQEAHWQTPHDLKNQFRSADPIGNKMVVFNIKGNDFRLLTKVDYQLQLVIVKNFWTHEEYDKKKLK